MNGTLAPAVIPQALLDRLLVFLEPGRWGKIELDIVNGKIVGCRLIESIKVAEETSVLPSGRIDNIRG